MDLLGEQSYAQQLKLSAKEQMQEEHDEDEAWKVFLNDWHNLDEIKHFNNEFKEKEADADTLADAGHNDWKKLLSGLNNIDVNQQFELFAEKNTKRDEEGAAVDNCDWKKILSDLNNWCDQMDNAAESDENLLDADAWVFVAIG